MSCACGAVQTRPASETGRPSARRGEVPKATSMIDAVFLTSNSREQAPECIAHLRVPEIARIVVVDNASTDGTAEGDPALEPQGRDRGRALVYPRVRQALRGAVAGAAPLSMRIVESGLDGVLIVEQQRSGDDRGFIARTYDVELMPPLLQMSTSFTTRAGTLRGLHYQVAPHGESKHVRCTRGAISDVAVCGRTRPRATAGSQPS